MTAIGPLTVSSMSASDGHITVEFTTERPHHRHFTMGFRVGDTPALDRAMEDFAKAATSAAMLAMMDVLGDTSTPVDIAEVLPNWQCRICLVCAPPSAPGWVRVVPLDGFPRTYCPEHADCG